MKNTSPRLERLETSHQHPDSGSRWTEVSALRVFIVTFLVIAIIGLVTNFSRAPRYESRAALLTSARTAVDRASAEADIQHVAIQSQRLLSDELMVGVVNRMRQDHGADLTVSHIRSLLSVVPLAETNLVEIVAAGDQAELLPAVISSWVSVYTEARMREIERSSAETAIQVNDQLSGISAKLDAARAELTEFRSEHDIISAERQENEVLSRLAGLSSALNNAIEEEVRAQSSLESIEESIARREQVVPGREKQNLQNLEKELQSLQGRMAELDARYTREYIALKPSLRAIPERITELETEIAAMLRRGSSEALNEAALRFDKARKTTANLRQQLSEHKQKVAEFTAIFDRHRALQSDLENLEVLSRKTQLRMVQLQTNQVEKYPQVDVVAPPRSTAERIGPDYLRDSLIALAAALLSALFMVWLARYLRPPPPPAATVTITGVPFDDLQRLGRPPEETRPALERTEPTTPPSVEGPDKTP